MISFEIDADSVRWAIEANTRAADLRSLVFGVVRVEIAGYHGLVELNANSLGLVELPRELRLIVQGVGQRVFHSVFLGTPEEPRVVISAGNNEEVVVFSFLDSESEFEERRDEVLGAIDAFAQQVCSLVHHRLGATHTLVGELEELYYWLKPQRAGHECVEVRDISMSVEFDESPDGVPLGNGVDSVRQYAGAINVGSAEYRTPISLSSNGIGLGYIVADLQSLLARVQAGDEFVVCESTLLSMRFLVWVRGERTVLFVPSETRVVACSTNVFMRELRGVLARLGSLQHGP